MQPQQPTINNLIGSFVGQQDPFGKSSKEPGSKLDAGKPPVFQGALDYFPRAIEAVASLSAGGAKKYTWKGWETVPDGENRYRNAEGRHFTRESIEGLWDSDMASRGEPTLHATQRAWNALANLELLLRRLEKENANGTAP